MATREEYLEKHESNLLETLSANYTSLNKNLVFCYTLFFFYVLFEFNFLKETSIAGQKLEITGQQLLWMLPLFTLLPYLLINNSIQNISRVVKLLKKNSAEIIKINSAARPFDIIDLEYQSQGVAGIQFEFSKFVIRKLLSGNLINFSLDIPKKRSFLNMLGLLRKFMISVYDLGRQILRTALWILFLVLLYILPLLFMIVLIFTKQLKVPFEASRYSTILTDYHFWIILLIIAMIIYTLISNLILYSFYFTELITLKKDFGPDGMSKINVVIRQVIKFYSKKGPSD